MTLAWHFETLSSVLYCKRFAFFFAGALPLSQTHTYTHAAAAEGMDTADLLTLARAPQT